MEAPSAIIGGASFFPQASSPATTALENFRNRRRHRQRRQPLKTSGTAVVGDGNARELGERLSSLSLGRSEEIRYMEIPCKLFVVCGGFHFQ